MCPEWTHLSHVFQWQAHAVSETAGGEHYDVHNPANTKTARGEQPKYAGAYFADIESMYPESAHYDRENERHEPVFIRYNWGR